MTVLRLLRFLGTCALLAVTLLAIVAPPTTLLPNARLATRGVVVAAIDYQLAPVYHAPTALNNVRAAIAFLKMRAAHFGTA